MSQNLLSRTQQFHRLQGVPSGAKAAAVGGNMMMYNPNGNGATPWNQVQTVVGGGNYAQQWADPNASTNAASLPNVAPMAAPVQFANPATVIRQALVPISIISQAEAGNQEKCVQTFPDNGRLYVNGILGGNAFFEIILTRMTAGGLDSNRMANTMIDAGIFFSQDIYKPFDGGCVNRDNPISVCFKAFNTPSELPFLNLHFFGTRDQAWNSCEPGLAIALQATGQLGVPML
jgi:hypothetical protein